MDKWMDGAVEQSLTFLCEECVPVQSLGQTERAAPCEL